MTLVQQQNNRKNVVFAFLLTLVWPFAGLIHALRKWREPWAKNMFWLVCIYMGAIQIFCPEGEIMGMGRDGSAYVVWMQEMIDYHTSFGEIMGQYLVDEHTMDLYQPLVSWLVSRFTANGHVLFFVFALVFGFFYSRNVWYILEKLRDNKLGRFFILTTLFFLVCPIYQINGVRMWTALQVFTYAMLPYLVEHKRTRLWCLLLTPFIHFSYLYVVILALFYCILPYRMKTKSNAFLILALLFFLITLFVNTIQLDTVSTALEEYSPESFDERIDQYVSQDALDKRNDASAFDNWYVAGSKNILFWCYNVLLLLILPCLKKHFKEQDGIMHLYVFTLLLSGFANLMAFIPSGGRFQLLTQMFKVALFLLVAFQIPRRDYFYLCLKVASLVLLVPLAVEFRKLFDYYGINLLFGNYITVFFWQTDVPLINFVKGLL